jgi:hypothetical protein
MKQKILLAFLSAALITSAGAQKKTERLTAYAITGVEKGSRNWKEVKLVDLETGELINPVFQSDHDVVRLNARTKKPVQLSATKQEQTGIVYIDGDRNKPMIQGEMTEEIKKILRERANNTGTTAPQHAITTRYYIINQQVNKDAPFATNSAACAFDKKSNRLYYTPMGFNQLRYIDLGAKTPTVVYFENEDFGTVKGSGDINNQITRMAIASDGNGYALSNDARQLVQFTTKKKTVITNLGSLSDDAANGRFSVHSSAAYGGDMVADDAGNLYLVTANRRVYRISLETKVAVYLGSIKGLPEGYTTNGAVADKGSNIVVTSSTSTAGYYRFNLDNLVAERISTGSKVFNASDLANGNLLSIKKKNEEKPEQPLQEQIPAKEELLSTAVEKSIRSEIAKAHQLSVYPNPVTNYSTRLSLKDYPEGRYEVQVVDLSGKQISKKAVEVNLKSQVVDLTLPAQLAKGNYLVRILNSSNQLMNVEKLLVQ